MIEVGQRWYNTNGGELMVDFLKGNQVYYRAWHKNHATGQAFMLKMKGFMDGLSEYDMKLRRVK